MFFVNEIFQAVMRLLAFFWIILVIFIFCSLFHIRRVNVFTQMHNEIMGQLSLMNRQSYLIH